MFWCSTPLRNAKFRAHIHINVSSNVCAFRSPKSPSSRRRFSSSFEIGLIPICGLLRYVCQKPIVDVHRIELVVIAANFHNNLSSKEASLPADFLSPSAGCIHVSSLGLTGGKIFFDCVWPVLGPGERWVAWRGQWSAQVQWTWQHEDFLHYNTRCVLSVLYRLASLNSSSQSNLFNFSMLFIASKRTVTATCYFRVYLLARMKNKLCETTWL